MKSKIIIISLMLLLFITSISAVFAEDLIDNTTVTTLNNEIEPISIEDSTLDNNNASEIIITDDNYDDYFNKFNGKFKQPLDKNVNTIKIGNVSEKIFTIDRPLNIMPVSSGCQIKNGVIHLIEGSSGSNITNLIINNTKGEIKIDGLFVSRLHGIWLSNSNDNLIFNNTIRIPGEEGCYAMPMGSSSRNKILYNDIVSTFTSCILMGSCDYNNISFNRIEITSFRSMVASNIIYMNSFGHADYRGVADCVGTYISNNYFKGFCNNEWSIIINALGKSDNTVIINNTIFRGFCGIKITDEWTGERQAINITIKNNTIINSTVSINAPDNNVIISGNRIIGSSMNEGIFTGHDEKCDISNLTISDNYIDYEDLSCGILDYTPNSIIKDNIIKISRYGTGMRLSGENSIAINNIIKTYADTGIVISNSSISVSNNFISTFGKGVSIVSEKMSDGRIYKYYNNSIVSNTILSDDYAVYIKGYVYNTLVEDNAIETNQSEAFYIDITKTSNDKNSGNFTDNTVNGVIENTETLIIDDSNFYNYFDGNGYLKYSFKPNSKKILFFTFLSNKDIFLTDSILLTSNKMPNLLYNVSITFNGDASDSLITDFNFYNFGKSSIILDGVDDVVIKNNDFTTVTDDIFEVNTISVFRGCVGCNITENNIFMNSKAVYTYGIYVSEPSHSILKKLSRNFNISKNNILIKSDGVGEAMYFDALVESDISSNSINIISEGSAYGISACNVFETLYDLNIASNEIFVNSKDMSYLIEIYRCQDCHIVNNFIFGFSNGVYGIGIYDSQGISIDKNDIEVCCLNLTNSPPADALGKGNSAIYITRQSQIDDISNNIFDCENTEIISCSNSTIDNIGENSFVISNYNYDLYFDSENILLNNPIKKNDRIMFKNFTDSKIMKINLPLYISSYNHFNDFKAVLILDQNSTGSVISNLNFINSNVTLNHVNSILIVNNSFKSSNINVTGFKNEISNNTFFNSSNVNIIDSLNVDFSFNNVTVSSEFINIFNSKYTLISNNSFNTSNTAIYSQNALNNIISANKFNINANFGYLSNNTHYDNFLDNTIHIDFDNPTAVYYSGNSSKNTVKYNRIISHSKEGFDYAVVVDSDVNRGNVIISNYLVAANGYKKGDNAVNASHDVVHDNVPVIIYVSVNGTDDGNGSFENPYQSISKAVENSIGGAIIHILPGMYNESNIVIDKNITLTAENIEGNTYINALNNQLFRIEETGTLTVNALKIFNGFCVEGGALFSNLGTLIINNSLIYNSSSYYDNSNPALKYGTATSFDCSKLGAGGAILNKGELIISSSTLFNNLAHKGGAIADFGKTTIKNSWIFNNSATHGGAIFTDSKHELTIENSVFEGNVALTTLDYCTIKRTETTHFGYRYVYSSECGVTPGHGGAIYSDNSITIKNSTFQRNVARSGGAIAYYSAATLSYHLPRKEINYQYFVNYYSTGSKFNLNIENSVFRYNEARDTQCGNLSLLKTDQYEPTYGQNCHGGAIFAELNSFTALNSLFEHNRADDTGGALCVQVANATIEGSKFYNNTAGSYGGALETFGNFNIFNTDISSNSAKKGGAIQYWGYSYYGHVQNNFNAYNVTISNNKALELGGAIVAAGTMSITHSNIYGNTAPEGATISGPYNTYDLGYGSVDARSNWWGSTEGPDDSVTSQRNIKFRTWLSDRVNWGAVSVKPSNNGDGNKGTEDKPSTTPTKSTGSGVHTGSTLKGYNPSQNEHNGLSFHFDGNWPSGNNNEGNGGFNNNHGFNGGDWPSGNNNEGNGGFNDNGGVNSFNSSGSGKNNYKGNVLNPNSLSQTNSSNVNDLASVGMTANSADSSSSGQSSSDESTGEDSSKAYEITKEIKNLDELDIKSSIFFVLFIILCVMFFIGFYRKYTSE